MLVHLTPVDLLCDAMGLCSAFAVAVPPGWTAEDTAAFEGRLKTAADRVVRKWPFLAGIPKRLGPKLWAIDVPDDVDELSKTRKLFALTSSSQNVPYHQAAGCSSPLSPLSSAKSGFLPDPKTELFCPPSVPADFTARVKQNLPLLHLHVTSFTDALAVGVNLPHGAFDGTGMGLVVRGLDAELHGREWQVPPVFEINPMQETCDAMVRDESLKSDDDLSAQLSGYTDSASLVAVARVISSALWEGTWFKCTERRVFFRQALLDSIAKKVKAEVHAKTGGKEYVSSGDVLVAWLLKTFHEGETDTSSFYAADPVYSLRSLLTTYTNPDGSSHDFSLYPHNSVVPYVVPPGHSIPLSEFASIPLSTLALDFRRGLLHDRTLPVLREVWRLQALSKGPLIPVKDWPELPSFLRRILPFETPHTTRWNMSNQTTLGFADLHLPGKDGQDLPLLSFYLFVQAPVAVDHYCGWQDVPGAGITLCGSTRKSRWDNLERAMNKIEEELAAEEAEK
ncbi:hypothetical protein JCM6882_008021 [Rhodosporidiobolus microsporus]